MIEKFIDFSARNRFLVIAAFLAITVVGYLVMRRTPVDAIPDLSENQVIVFTDWMGRSPQEIEDQITYPLSVNLQGLAGVKTVRASSEFNFSMINVIFDDSVDYYFARDRVLERLSLARTFLPPDVTPYMAPDSTALGQIFWYTVEGDGVSLDQLRTIQDWQVRYQLNAVPGVAQVASVGGMPREYQIDVIPERLRAYNISLGELYAAVAKSNSAVGGGVIQKGKAEYLIRSIGWIRNVEDIRNTVILQRDGVPIRVGDVAVVQLGPEFRRSALEKNGREAVGGVVMMRFGENPLEITRRVQAKIAELQRGMPAGVTIVPFYDRTRLIEGAIDTVDRVLLHEIIIAGIAILLILTHFRSVFVVVVTLPLAILIAFILMHLFGIGSNIMSLSGIAISIGILVDQSIVMLENSTHHLYQRFGTGPITGDTTEIVARACRQVGRPIFFSVLIMVISFLPVFALGGQGGKMFHPLAFTKTFALLGTALISITLVPAIIPLLVRGRLRREEDNYIVRSVVQIYRPVLGWLMPRPKLVIALFALLVAVGIYLYRDLGSEFMPKLDEGSIMDMPVTSPRASITEVVDDIKARDALLREFPEVEMAVGKAGRADTPTDPAPLEMIETIITLRPKDHWAKRKLNPADARAEISRLTDDWIARALIQPFATPADRAAFLEETTTTTLVEFDRRMRLAWLNRQLRHQADLAAQTVDDLARNLFDHIDSRRGFVPFAAADPRPALQSAWRDRFSPVFQQHFLATDVEAFLTAALADLQAQKLLRPDLADPLGPEPGLWQRLQTAAADALGDGPEPMYLTLHRRLVAERSQKTAAWVGAANQAAYDGSIAQFEAAAFERIESVARAQQRWTTNPGAGAPVNELSAQARLFGGRTFLWPATKKDLIAEMDAAIQQLGWVNIWTQPIDNRINMLATGVRTEIGVKVISNTKDLETLQKVANQVRDVLITVPGAVDVQADQSNNKGYVEITVDRDKAARYGVNVGDIQEAIEVAMGGRMITMTVEDRERYPVRVRYARDYRTDENAIRRILITLSAGMPPAAAANAGMSGGGMSSITPASMAAASSAAAATERPSVYLGDVADVQVVNGPKMIASENGYLRSNVTCNVRGRDAVGFQAEAERRINAEIRLPAGYHLEWTGEFEQQRITNNRMLYVVPAVLILIFVILYLTYKDLAHASLMMLAIPGALAGGVIVQWIGGFNFSTAVVVGYIACFGMATETGVIMLVYLREAIERRGGLEKIQSLEELKQAVMEGAVHRLRPKLLTEGTAILGLAPMVFEHGTGSEIMQPMAAPVLGGLLFADEVIDIFLPVLFYHVEAFRWRIIHAGQQAAAAPPAAAPASGPETLQPAN